ncbi:hypothetical protein ACFLZ1_03970 [Patescibacteria group bacterium]
MEYKKLLKIIALIDALLIVFLGVISFRFLTDQIRRTQEVQPEILAQYNTELEIGKFLEVKEKIEKRISKP